MNECGGADEAVGGPLKKTNVVECPYLRSRREFIEDVLHVSPEVQERPPRPRAAQLLRFDGIQPLTGVQVPQVDEEELESHRLELFRFRVRHKEWEEVPSCCCTFKLTRSSLCLDRRLRTSKLLLPSANWSGPLAVSDKVWTWTVRYCSDGVPRAFHLALTAVSREMTS